MVSQGTYLGYALYDATRGSTWPFIFIAGFLFAHLRDRYTWASYSANKLKNVIAPYVLIVSALLALGIANPFHSEPPLQHFLLGYPAARPLWFIPMIALFFAGFPFYRTLCKFPRTLLALTAGAFLFSSLAGRPDSDAGPLSNFLYFQSAWLFGIAWRVHREKFDAFISRYHALIILALVVGINVGMGLNPFAERGQIFMWAPLTTILVVAMRNETPLDPLWTWLASRSFGIFFLHGIVTDRLPGLVGTSVNGVAALIFGIALTAACGLAVDGVRMLTGNRSRLLVGA